MLQPSLVPGVALHAAYLKHLCACKLGVFLAVDACGADGGV
jgi:hypothetical protein